MLEQAEMSLQQAGIHIAATATEWARASVMFRPTLTVDGNQFCALYGDNLHDGCAGFGDTPAKAMEDFDNNWHTFSMVRKSNDQTKS